MSAEDEARRREQAEALGIDIGTLPKAESTRIDYRIWPEHWQALEMFLAVQTQWRAGGSGVIGLDYKVILELCSIYEVTDTKQLLQDMQVMELHARELINKAAGE